MVEPAELLALSQPKRSSPLVTCGILALGTVLVLGLLIFALAYREHRQEQGARERALAAIQKATSATISDCSDGRITKIVTLSGDDAEILGELARRLLEQNSHVDSWSHNHARYELELLDQSGVSTRFRFEGRQQYYLEESDEWYTGQAEFTTLLKVIAATHVLATHGRGIPLLVSAQVNAVVDGLNTLEMLVRDYHVQPWADVTASQRAFVERWLQAFNRVSGEPPRKWPG
jgi:hypothetical protein